MDIDATSTSVTDGLRSPLFDEQSPPRASHDSGILPRISAEINAAESVPISSRDAADQHTDLERASQDTSDLQRNEVLSTRPSRESARRSIESPEVLKGDNQESAIAQLQAEHKAAEAQWQDEMHLYIERIDALQSKLKYLAKEAVESAKNAAANAPPGSVEKQLSEKDEKMALLLEEGQKLSKSEMDHRTVIKKLRQQLTENTKSQAEAKKKAERLERDVVSADARAKRAEAAEKRANESLSSQMRTTTDLANERNALAETVQEMKAQLSRTVARAEAAEAKAQSHALEEEKRKATELEEELASMKIERDISTEKARREVSDLKERIEQERERARMLEAELKGEQSVLESKMESLRARAEEASSGATSETQAKLLRQIETLQTQYAVASENWQTLEGSLLARLANMERERDDMGRREGDLQKRIREMVSIP